MALAISMTEDEHKSPVKSWCSGMHVTKQWGAERRGPEVRAQAWRECCEVPLMCEPELHIMMISVCLSFWTEWISPCGFLMSAQGLETRGVTDLWEILRFPAQPSPSFLLLHCYQSLLRSHLFRCSEIWAILTEMGLRNHAVPGPVHIKHMLWVTSLVPNKGSFESWLCARTCVEHQEQKESKCL